MLLRYLNPRYPNRITNNPTNPASQRVRFWVSIGSAAKDAEVFGTEVTAVSGVSLGSGSVGFALGLILG